MSLEEYKIIQLERYGSSFYLDEDLTHPNNPRYTVLSVRIQKEMQRVLQDDDRHTNATVLSLEETEGIELIVKGNVPIYTSRNNLSKTLADQLMTGERLRILPPLVKDQWSPVVIHHDFESQAPMEIGWLQYNPLVLIKPKKLSLGNNLQSKDFGDTVEKMLSIHTGIKYLMSGKTPEMGYDCSGFTQTIFRETHGLILPRLARWQALVGEEVTMENLEPEDLIYFADTNQRVNHVGFVYKPQPGKLPIICHCLIRAGIVIEDLNKAPWLNENNTAIAGYRRLIPIT